MAAGAVAGTVLSGYGGAQLTAATTAGQVAARTASAAGNAWAENYTHVQQGGGTLAPAPGTPGPASPGQVQPVPEPLNDDLRPAGGTVGPETI